MQFILTGFTQDMGFRVFAFERIAEDRSRTACIVRADLGLSRQYGIRVQELPLLCRALLEQHDEPGDNRTLVFTEAEMRLYADNRAAARDAAALRKKPARRPPKENSGIAWRGPRP